MSLVNELQEIAETDDILIVLRKAKRLSGKLGRTDILDWINKEINGYGPNDLVPEYRKLESALVYNTNGYIPAGLGCVKSGVERVRNFPSLPMSVRMDVGTLASVPDDKIMCEMLSPELELEWKSKLVANSWDGDSVMHQISLMIELPNIGIKKIVQTVRDRVLDWAIKLEQEGITGSKHTFTQKEKEVAQNMNVVNFGSMKTVTQSGDNPVAVQIDNEVISQEIKKSIFDYICSWYGGIIGGTASILGAWWFAWEKWDVWFFWL